MLPFKKTNPVLKLSNSLVELACPKNISSLWTFGSLLGMCLVTQIITGLFLAMYFTADINLAFDSAIYISRDVNYGWLIRNIHANGASMFFVCMYIHTGRGLYYSSFLMKETWLIGVTLLFITILTAFLGYVLPWGQMSYWAATVITNLLSAIPYIGNLTVMWIWGGFSVSNATLIRFYALHFLFPFLIAALSLVHILFLHEKGSNNPTGLPSKNETMKFHMYFTIKDLIGVCTIWITLGSIVLLNPNILIDPENFIPANPLVTPTHIQPEWYFLPMYAILRSIPNKLGGVLALVMSIAVLYFIPMVTKPKKISMSMNPIMKMMFWLLVSNFILLMWVGSKPVEYPFESIGQVFTLLYFMIYMIIPIISKPNKLIY